MKFYYVTNIFDLHTFENEMTVFLEFFKISTEIDFVSMYFLNERNITTSLLMMHLKRTVAHYAYLNPSFINKPYLRAFEYAISCFFLFLIYDYFNEAFVKNFMKKLSFFNTNFKNSFQDVVYILQNIRMFFRFLIYNYFNEAFIKNFMKKLSLLIQISKIYFKM